MRAPDRPLIKAPCGELPRRLGRRRLRLHADGDAAGAKVSRRSKKRSRIEPAGAGSCHRCRSVPPYAARCAATGASTRHRLRLDRSSNLRVGGSQERANRRWDGRKTGSRRTERPNSPTETNTGRVTFGAQNPQSPVRLRQGPTAKTPRNRGDFPGRSGARATSLCSSRLDGGGGSLERTRLCCRFPDLQGKYREVLRNWTLLTDSGPRFRSHSAVVATDSL
jgi:hypothetical protein